MQKKRVPRVRQSEPAGEAGIGPFGAALGKLEGHKSYVIQTVIGPLIEDFARDPALPRETRISTLLQLLSLLAGCIDEVTHSPLTRAPLLWRDRDRRKYSSPVLFTQEVYAPYLSSITQADIRNIDPYLYRSLHNWKQRYGWPKDFALSTKRSQTPIRLEHYLSKGSSPTDIDILLDTLRPEVRLFETLKNLKRAR